MRCITSVLLLLMLSLPRLAQAEFFDCLFTQGFENAGTTNTAALGALEVHNCARRSVEPAASSAIPSLRWDAVVAASAQAWADNCQYAHGGHAGYGQNIYAAAGFVPTLADAALAWANEEPNYDYTLNTCTSGACGHYTQMVWATTTRLGCGQAQCSTGSPFGTSPWHLIVCNYAPPGNYLGTRPY